VFLFIVPEFIGNLLLIVEMLLTFCMTKPVTMFGFDSRMRGLLDDDRTKRSFRSICSLLQIGVSAGCHLQGDATGENHRGAGKRDVVNDRIEKCFKTDQEKISA
jgi:hypothetical protein